MILLPCILEPEIDTQCMFIPSCYLLHWIELTNQCQLLENYNYREGKVNLVTCTFHDHGCPVARFFACFPL